MAQPDRVDASRAFRLPFVLLATTGLLLLAVSVILNEHRSWHDYASSFLKELGIVVLSVFTVSLLYEWLLSQRHFQTFLSSLSAQLAQGESNAAACARLGVREIFPTRDVFEVKYPLHEALAQRGPADRVRVVGRSLLPFMMRASSLRAAIDRGACVDLCLFSQDPRDDAADTLGHEAYDERAAIARFGKDVAHWLEGSKPDGSVEVRLHRVHLFDTFLMIEPAGGEPYGIWDLSFGSDPRSRTIVLVDLDKTLGAGLKQRYDRIWDKARARTIFRYRAGVIEINKLNEAEHEPVGHPPAPR